MSDNRDLPPPSSREGIFGDRATWPKVLTRSAVARMLRMSISTLRYHERKRRLNPKTGVDGIKRFDRNEVEQFARTRRQNGYRTAAAITGDVVADVLRMIQDGHSLRDICMKLELLPEQVRTIWRESKGGFDSPSPHPDPARDTVDLSDQEKGPDVAAQILAARRRRRGGE
jgi:DNA-binding transcriptional MerR regulator